MWGVFAHSAKSTGRMKLPGSFINYILLISRKICEVKKKKIDIYIQENSWGLTSKALSATKWRKSFLEYYFFRALGFAHEIGSVGVLTDLVCCAGIVLKLKKKRASHVELKKKIDTDILKNPLTMKS